MSGWEEAGAAPPKIEKKKQQYQDLVAIIRKNNLTELRLHPNIVEYLRKEHDQLHNAAGEDQHLEGRPPFIIEGCLIIGDYHAS